MYLACAAQAAAKQQAKPAQHADAAITVTDDVGRQVEVPQPVSSIVSLAPSVTETIYALGAQDRLVADTDYCDYPPEAKQKPKIGGVINPNLDSGRHEARSGGRRRPIGQSPRNGGRARAPARATYATDARTVADMLQSVSRLATVLDAEEQGRAVVESLRTRLDDLRRKLESVAPTRVLFVVWTGAADLRRRRKLSCRCPASRGRRVRDSNEAGLAARQSGRSGAPAAGLYRFCGFGLPTNSSDYAGLRHLPGWRDLKAVEENRIVIMSDAINCPAPRLVDAIEELARQLHPEAFAPPHVDGLASTAVRQCR